MYDYTYVGDYGIENDPVFGDITQEDLDRVDEQIDSSWGETDPEQPSYVNEATQSHARTVLEDSASSLTQPGWSWDTNLFEPESAPEGPQPEDAAPDEGSQQTPGVQPQITVTSDPTGSSGPSLWLLAGLAAVVMLIVVMQS
jgi:hypothetical protein